MRTALFIGRFQPLHKGHEYAIKGLFREYRKVVIVIGSIKKKNTENPFSFQERKAMMDAVLRKYKNHYKIIGVSDFKSDAKWKNEIVKKARFDVVVTGNKWTKRCFQGYKIVNLKMLSPKTYNATRIRRLITQDKDWMPYVPVQIVPIIKKYA